MADNRGFGVTSTTTAGGTADAEAQRKALADWYAQNPGSAPDAVKASEDAASSADIPGFAQTLSNATDAVTNATGAVGTALSGGNVDQNAHQAVATDVDRVRSARDALYDAYGSAQPRTAPTANAPTIAPVTTVAPTTVGPAATLTPTTVGNAAQAGAAPAVTAGAIAPTSIGPAATYGASQVAQTPNAVAGQAGFGGIDTSQQAQFRAAQQGLVTSLQGAANGTVPSAAEAQLQRANDQAVQQQAALTAGAHGTSRLTQRLEGAQNVADLQQKNALDTAQLRAQEQATARGQLGTALEGARGQDIGLATTGATLATDVSKTNAGLSTNVSISNADRAAAAAMKDADLQQAANAGNAAAINELKSRQAALNSTENIAGASNALDASKANAGNATQLGIANAQAQNQLTALQAQITSQQGIATAEQQNELSKLQAQITAGAATTNATEANSAAKAQAQIQLQTELANQDAKLKQQGLDDASRQALLQAYAEQAGAALGWDKNEAALNVARATADKQLLGSIVGGLAGIGAAAATTGGKAAGA